MSRVLSVASPLMHGQDVLDVQERLATLGYKPGVQDGRYGPTTEAAVRAFQDTHGLDVDGAVGPLTLKALDAPDAKRQPPAPAGSLGLLALTEARKHLGVKESPAGSNNVEFNQWFYDKTAAEAKRLWTPSHPGPAWCNVGVSYCFQKGAAYTICHGFSGAGVNAHGCAYVPTTEAWLRATGMWLGRSTALPGDIAIFNWDGGVPDHIGLVERWLGGGQFTSVEFNTAVGADSDGGEVMRRLRYISQVDGFGRVKA